MPRAWSVCGRGRCEERDGAPAEENVVFLETAEEPPQAPAAPSPEEGEEAACALFALQVLEALALVGSSPVHCLKAATGLHQRDLLGALLGLMGGGLVRVEGFAPAILCITPAGREALTPGHSPASPATKKGSA